MIQPAVKAVVMWIFKPDCLAADCFTAMDKGSSLRVLKEFRGILVR